MAVSFWPSSSTDVSLTNVTVRRAALCFVAAGHGYAAGAPAPITGGSPSRDAGVVALSYGDTLECTGTVIAPHAVLTAAHCVMGSTPPDVAIGETLAAATRHEIVAVFVHPQFDPQTLDHDLAVALVESTLGVPPIPFATELGGAMPGTTIRVVGYGWTVAGDETPAARRTGTSQLDAIEASRLVSHAAPSQACHGDSGGPALHDEGSGERVIGVASSGDTSCAQFVKHTRVDVHADFITDAVARTADGAAAAGQRCWYDANCAVGACVPAADEPRWSFCAPPCTDGDCAGDLECVTIDGDARCRHPLPSPGAAGTTCATDRDCASELCLAPAGHDDTVCTQRCFSDLPGLGCPADSTCHAATDGREACFAPPDTGGGCSATSGADASLALAIAVLVQRLRGRGRS